MKLLTISRGKLELARVHLLKPILTIGRSPTNDVVLRAPGVAPIHFLIEWIGTGEFDPVGQDTWSIADISAPLKQKEGTAVDSAAEGVILTEESVALDGFQFTKTNDALAAEPVIGGAIRGKLTKTPTFYGTSVLSESVIEVVQIRTDSGAIEEVRHISSIRAQVPRSILAQIPEFKIQWDKGSGDKIVKVLLTEMPGAVVYNRGQKVAAQGSCQIQPNDVLQVRWKSHDFFIRFVPRILVPLVPRALFSDPFFRKVAGLVSIVFILLLGLAYLTHTDQETLKEPPRIAKIEVAAPEAPKPPQPPLPPPPPPPPPPKEDTEIDKPKVGLENAASNKNPGQAAKPKYVAPPNQKQHKIGLNSPADVGNANQVGILGALKGAGAKGKGVRADMVINNGIISDTAGSKDDDSKIVVKNPPAGILGRGTGGNPRGKGEDLAAAGTTFGGGKDYNPGAVGPISRKGATGEGYEAGTALGKGGSGVGGGSGNDIGSLDTGNFSVEGGLDKETVRRVIHGHAGEIRTCYEKALVSNSNISGRIKYRWQISPSGPVVSVVVQDSSVSSSTLESCVLDVIRNMMFPAAPNGRPTTVIYPFVFQARK